MLLKIDQFLALSAVWRWLVLCSLSLIMAFVLFYFAIGPQLEELTAQERKQRNVLERINWFDQYELTVNSLESEISQREQQLDEFEQRLSDYNNDAPESFILDAIALSSVNPREISISEKMHDDFGLFYRIQVEVVGHHKQILQFFQRQFNSQQMLVWEQLNLSSTGLEKSHSVLALRIIMRKYVAMVYVK